MRSLVAGLVGLAALVLAAPASATLVYVKDPAGASRIWVAGDDGSGPRELVAGAQPQIAPNGATVAFTRARGRRTELWTVGVDGRGARRLAAASAVESVAFSPDSTLLAAEVGGRRLAVYEVATGRGSTLLTGFVKGLSFSPDSQRIAYGLGRDATARGASDVRTVSVLGGRSRALTDDGRSLLPVWGPRRIAYVRQKGAGAAAIPAYDVWTMTSAGERRRRVTVTKVPDGVSGLLPVEWSGDGRRMIAQYVGADVRVGFTVDPRTGTTRSLRRKVAFDLAADGATVLTHSGGAELGGRHNVYAAPFDGGPSTLLVRNAAFPDWTR